MKRIMILLMAVTAISVFGARIDNPVDTSEIEADIAANTAAVVAAQATADAALPKAGGSMDVGSVVTNLTVDKIYFENGGTNSWITFASATNGILRINGSNTVWNVDLGKL